MLQPQRRSFLFVESAVTVSQGAHVCALLAHMFMQAFFLGKKGSHGVLPGIEGKP